MTFNNSARGNAEYPVAIARDKVGCPSILLVGSIIFISFLLGILSIIGFSKSVDAIIVMLVTTASLFAIAQGFTNFLGTEQTNITHASKSVMDNSSTD